MCGRFSHRLSWSELHELMDLIGRSLDLRHRCNAAPGQVVAVASTAEEGCTLSMLRRDLIPAFRTAFRRWRCPIPVDGFHEWQRRGGTRRPGCSACATACISPSPGCGNAGGGRKAMLPGLLAESEPGEVIETGTVLATAAHEMVAEAHGRMPVIQPRDACGAWLAGEKVPMKPYPADEMTAHPGSPRADRSGQRRPALRRAVRAVVMPGLHPACAARLRRQWRSTGALPVALPHHSPARSAPRTRKLARRTH